MSQSVKPAFCYQEKMKRLFVGILPKAVRNQTMIFFTVTLAEKNKTNHCFLYYWIDSKHETMLVLHLY